MLSSETQWVWSLTPGLWFVLLFCWLPPLSCGIITTVLTQELPRGRTVLKWSQRKVFEQVSPSMLYQSKSAEKDRGEDPMNPRSPQWRKQHVRQGGQAVQLLFIQCKVLGLGVTRGITDLRSIVSQELSLYWGNKTPQLRSEFLHLKL